MARTTVKPRSGPYEMVALEYPVPIVGGETTDLRIYRPKMGDYRAIGVMPGENITIDQLLDLIELLARDIDGGPLKTRWTDELDHDDMGAISKIMAIFFGGGQETGES